MWKYDQIFSAWVPIRITIPSPHQGAVWVHEFRCTSAECIREISSDEIVFLSAAPKARPHSFSIPGRSIKVAFAADRAWLAARRLSSGIHRRRARIYIRTTPFHLRTEWKIIHNLLSLAERWRKFTRAQVNLRLDFSRQRKSAPRAATRASRVACLMHISHWITAQSCSVLRLLTLCQPAAKKCT